MLWVNGQKYENLLQFNTSWLASLRTWYILDFVLASVIVAITLYLNAPPPFLYGPAIPPENVRKVFLSQNTFLDIDWSFALMHQTSWWLPVATFAHAQINHCASHLDLTDQKLLAKLTTYTFLILRLLVRHKVEAFKLMNHDIRNMGKLHTFPRGKMYWIEKAIEKR